MTRWIQSRPPGGLDRVMFDLVEALAEQMTVAPEPTPAIPSQEDE